IPLASLVLALTPTFLAADSPAPAQHDPYDVRITLRVRRVLAQDTDLSGFNINATVRRGSVTLWGRVPNGALVQRAVAIARRVQGVFQVHSKLSVGPTEPGRDDMPRLPASISIPTRDAPPGSRDPRSRG